MCGGGVFCGLGLVDQTISAPFFCFGVKRITLLGEATGFGECHWHERVDKVGNHASLARMCQWNRWIDRGINNEDWEKGFEDIFKNLMQNVIRSWSQLLSFAVYSDNSCVLFAHSKEQKKYSKYNWFFLMRSLFTLDDNYMVIIILVKYIILFLHDMLNSFSYLFFFFIQLTSVVSDLPASCPVYVWKQHVCASARQCRDVVRDRKGDRRGGWLMNYLCFWSFSLWRFVSGISVL